MMAYKLWQLIRDGLTGIGELNIGAATGGSTTTLIDTYLRTEANDIWNEGTLIILKDAAGAGAAPEGEFRRVSDFVNSTATLTVAPAFSVAPAAGDRYGLVGKEFGVELLYTLANDALQKWCGDFIQVDTTTLDTAASQTEYACAVLWKRGGPFRVDIQGNTSDANDNRWVEYPKGMWEYIPAAPGSTGLIVFREQPITTRDIRVWYRDVHPEVTAYSSVIHEAVPPALARAALKLELASYRAESRANSDDSANMGYNKASNELERLLQRMSIKKVGKKHGLFILGEPESEYTGTANLVRV